MPDGDPNPDEELVFISSAVLLQVSSVTLIPCALTKYKVWMSMPDQSEETTGQSSFPHS